MKYTKEQIEEYRKKIFEAMRDYVNEDGEHPYTEQEAKQITDGFSINGLSENLEQGDTPESFAEFFAQ